jgi:hypothetical protein
MADEGWEVFECVRRPESFGLWTVLFCRQGQKDFRRKIGQDLSEDRLDLNFRLKHPQLYRMCRKADLQPKLKLL